MTTGTDRHLSGPARLPRRVLLNAVLSASAGVALAACGTTVSNATGSSTSTGATSPASKAPGSASSSASSAAAATASNTAGSSGSATTFAQTPRQVASPGQVVYAYVFNVASKDVTIIDTEKNEVVETKPLGASVRWLSDEQDFYDGQNIWTYDFPDNKLDVIVIDPRAWKVIQRVPAGTGPGHSVILSKDRAYAMVNVAGDDKLSVVDTKTLQVTHTTAVGKFPCDLDFTTDGTWGYTPERDQDTLAKINLADFSIAKRVTFPAGSKPHMLRVSPDNKFVWVQAANAGTNTVLDAQDLSVKNQQELGKTPVTNAWTPDGSQSWVTNAGSTFVSVLDNSTYKLLGTVQVGQGPSVIGFRPDGKYAYVSVTGANAVAVVDVQTRAVTKTLKAGTQPQGLIVMPPFSG